MMAPLALVSLPFVGCAPLKLGQRALGRGGEGWGSHAAARQQTSCSMKHSSTSQLVGRMNARRAGEGRGGLGLTCGSSSANILLDETLLHITTGGSHECAEGRGFA